MSSISIYPLKYNAAAIILYFIGLEISNLYREIKNKSPKATKQLSSDINILTPEQIEEAQKDFTGFVKNAISVSAKRQEAMNLVEAQLTRAKEFVFQIDDVLASALQSPPPISQEEFERLNRARLNLRTHEDNIALIETKIKAASATINNLLDKHAEEWRQHYKKYIEQLIAELDTKKIILSDIEKKELSEHTKTIEEIKLRLKKEEII